MDEASTPPAIDDGKVLDNSAYSSTESRSTVP